MGDVETSVIRKTEKGMRNHGPKIEILEWMRYLANLRGDTGDTGVLPYAGGTGMMRIYLPPA
jgi:hypothetical protein